MGLLVGRQNYSKPRGYSWMTIIVHGWVRWMFAKLGYDMDEIDDM
jgi:hypothetical protein